MSHQPNPLESPSEQKALFFTELEQAVNELTQVLSGQLLVRDAEKLLEELDYPDPTFDRASIWE